MQKLQKIALVLFVLSTSFASEVKPLFGFFEKSKWKPLHDDIDGINNGKNLKEECTKFTNAFDQLFYKNTQYPQNFSEFEYFQKMARRAGELPSDLDHDLKKMFGVENNTPINYCFPHCPEESVVKTINVLREYLRYKNAHPDSLLSLEDFIIQKLDGKSLPINKESLPSDKDQTLKQQQALAQRINRPAPKSEQEIIESLVTIYLTDSENGNYQVEEENKKITISFKLENNKELDMKLARAVQEKNKNLFNDCAQNFDCAVRWISLNQLYNDQLGGSALQYGNMNTEHELFIQSQIQGYGYDGYLTISKDRFNKIKETMNKK